MRGIWGRICALTFVVLIVVSGCKDDDSEPSPYISMYEYLEQNSDLYPEYEETESGLRYIIQEQGEGAFAMAGDVVQVHYTGYHMNGEAFESSYDRGTPIGFELGNGEVIAGWDEGIALLKKGGKAVLFIPSNLAYGDTGNGTVRPNEDLKFEVKLVDIR